MIKHVLLLISLFASLSTLTNSYAVKELADLKYFEWDNRIVLVRPLTTTDVPDGTSCEQAITTLEQAEIDIDDRHIIWFVLCESQSEWLTRKLVSNYKGSISPSLSDLIERRYLEPSKDSVVLIGKDGDVKYRASKLDLKSIKLRVDSMPMRQYEMAEKK